MFDDLTPEQEVKQGGDKYVFDVRPREEQAEGAGARTASRIVPLPLLERKSERSLLPPSSPILPCPSSNSSLTFFQKGEHQMPGHMRPRPLPPPPDHRIAASDEPSSTGLDTLAQLQQKQDPGIEEAGDDAQTIEEKELAPEAEERREDFYARIGEVRSSDEEYDEANSPEFAIVKLADVREIVQCPICLGIIRKTRTVMECLHRFCRECIDKSMRLGNNECPACRTHCASRRSLRDDPKYDALIAALYPDIDKYEEELAFLEEERSHNRKIQLYIAETFQRQSEALGRTRSTTRASTSFGRKAQGSYLHGRGRKNIASGDTAMADSDEVDVNGNNGTKDSSSTDETSPDQRPKRCKEWGTPQSSPARTVGSANVSSEENEDFEINREPVRTSPLQARNREILAWGKNGTRSQTRHNSSSSSNGRLVRGGRMGKLVDYLRNLEEVDEKFDIHVTMVPLDDSMPNLEQPYLSCGQTLLITHLRQFIALQTSAQPEEVEIFVRKPQDEPLAVRSGSLVDNASTDSSIGLKILEGGESLGTLYASYSEDKGELVLLYFLKIQR